MLSQLRVFLVALKEGSLNRAATRLRMSQSALSRQMQALESEIGGPLLGGRGAHASIRKNRLDLRCCYDACRGLGQV